MLCSQEGSIASRDRAWCFSRHSQCSLQATCSMKPDCVYTDPFYTCHTLPRRCSNGTQTHLQINASSALLCSALLRTILQKIEDRSSPSPFASQSALPIVASTQAMSVPNPQSMPKKTLGSVPPSKRAPSPGRRQSASDTPPSTSILRPGSKPGSLRSQTSFDSNNSQYKAQMAEAISNSHNAAALRRHSIDFAMPADEGDTARGRSSSQTRSTARPTAAPTDPTKVKMTVGRRTASQDSYGFRRDPVSPYTPGSNPYRERTTLKPGLLHKAYNKITGRLGQLRTR
jgi:hypothetical protein